MIVAAAARSAASPVDFSVSVALVVEVPVALSELLLHDAETPAGSPETASVTGPVNDPPVFTMIESFAVFPCRTAIDPAAAVMPSVGGTFTVRAAEAVAVIPSLVPVSAICDTPAAALVAVTLTVTLEPGFALAGETDRETPASPVALIATESEKPPAPATTTAKLVELPLISVKAVPEGVIVNPFFGAGDTTAPGQTLASTLASTEPSPVARL